MINKHDLIDEVDLTISSESCYIQNSGKPDGMKAVLLA